MNESYLNSEKNIALLSKPSIAKRLLLMVLFVSITSLVSFGQCTLPSGATSVGTYTFCIDSPNNPITTATVKAGQYALVNVVKGFNYTFSVKDVWTGSGNQTQYVENLTLFDASNDTAFGLSGYNSGQGGTSITWTSTISGQIKVLLSKNCGTASSGGKITLTLNSLGNTQDSQTAFGTDTWTGHIYNYTAGVSPEPFTTANYAGYYNVGSETISENFGGDYGCFPVYSNGIQRASIYTEQFAVRYRMKSTRPAGYYFMSANADDGIRITVDGVSVLNDWTDHGNNQYCNNLVYLTGSSDIILDYYENAEVNVVGFNLTSITGNTISSYADRNVCSGNSPGNLDGSNILNCTGTTSTTYQWQSSTDNVNFTNITGATSEDYTPPAVTTSTVNIKYYRRVLKASGVAITASNPATGSVKVITSSSAPAAPGAITGSATQCAGNTLQTYSVAAVTNATSYNWTLPANWTITAGVGTNSITVSIPSNGATGNVSVNAINGCGTGYGPYKGVTVSTPTVAGTITPANINICSGSSTNLSLSGQTGSILRWESSTDNFAGGPITTIASTGSPITASNVTVDTYYRAVVQSGGCNVLNTNSAKVSVVGAMANPGGISINGVSYPVNGSTTSCASTTTTFSIAPVANATSYTWTVGGGWSIVSGQGKTSVSVTTGNTSQSNNISVYATNGTCPQTGSTYLWVTLTNTAAPTGTAVQSFCSGATITSLSATGTNIQWYATSSGGSPLATTTALVNGTHYYATQTVNGCESTTRFDVTATVNAAISAPTVGTKTQPTCSTATGSVVLNGLPSGSWILTQNPGGTTTTGTGTSTTISGLSSGTYTYSVVGANNGLKAEYFNSKDLSGPAVLTRTDATVSFDWGNGSPDSSINNEAFSARWSGLVQPLYSETYTFKTTSDDGVRLWVNGVKIIDNWTDHAVFDNTGTIALTAGEKYNIVLEYYENGGLAVSKLSWSSPTNPTSVIIPTTQLFSVSTCTSPASANVVIDAQPAMPVTPTVGAPTQPTCSVPTGSFAISNYNSSYTYSVSPSTGVTISGSTVTAPVGSYTVTASSGGCTSSASPSVVINAAVAKTWKGTAWLPDGIAPTKDDVVIINGNYNTSSNGDLNACSLTIKSGSLLTVTAGKFVVVQNDLTVDGTLDVLDKGSLVMVNDAGIVSGTGKTTIRKFTTATKKLDFVYWSTPVVSTTIATTFLGWRTDRAFEYNNDNKAWKYATAMDPAKGYIITVPNSGGIAFADFEGKVNNGVIKVKNIVASAPYLIGNPYPSAIDADAFLSENAEVIEGTIYFWTHNTAIQLASKIPGTAGSGAYAFTSDDYATYNIVGGVATGLLSGVGNLPISGGTLKPTGQIASCQGFFASSNDANRLASNKEIVFKNGMRLGSGDKSLDNTNFFRTKASKTAKTFEKNRLWLNLTNTGGAFKQLLVGYVTDATNDYESRFDGESFAGNQYIDFYSVVKDKNLTIQGRALPFDEKDEVPLGYNTTIEGPFTISLDDADGFMSNQSVFLEDKLTNTVFDLKAANYTFNTAKGTFNDRFVLKYANKTLGMEEVVEKEDGILALYASNYQTLIIHNKGIASTVNSVTLFNMTGQKIGVWNVKDFEQTNIQIPIKDISSGIYIVKISTTNGDSSKKIVVN